ncbi:P-loop containing nucleoside triphosphate hydrolase protein [Kalaharituber pfeilii]|nr:P-loop containing nucleoside triphosphate hydrolase protein [Kalaharituber pfeilii]
MRGGILAQLSWFWRLARGTLKDNMVTRGDLTAYDRIKFLLRGMQPKHHSLVEKRAFGYTSVNSELKSAGINAIGRHQGALHDPDSTEPPGSSETQARNTSATGADSNLGFKPAEATAGRRQNTSGRAPTIDATPDLPPLDAAQSQILELAKQGHNIFFTGPAGSGKSLIIQHLKAHYESQRAKIAVTAPTGIAATLVGGKTIHSWAGIGRGDKPVHEYIKMLMGGYEKCMTAEKKRNTSMKNGMTTLGEIAEQIQASMPDVKTIVLETTVLMIDEVSMLSPDVFSKLNKLMKALRHSEEFFGMYTMILQ